MSISNSLPLQPFDDIPIPPPVGRMTEEQFVAWCTEDVRAEWVDGEVIIMSPASSYHSELIFWLAGVIGYYIDEKQLGRLFGIELITRLAAIKQRRLPDLMFVDKSRSDIIRPTYLEGPPDMALEVVSDDSVDRDWKDKYAAYARAGVREYWVIDPLVKRAALFVLVNGRFEQAEEADGWLASTVIGGLRLKTVWFWPETRPTRGAALREMGLSTP